ncbi:MAG TPA: class I adenylate-forming enzyme family protein [Amycolatopsis sp.]|nr:class I adenylate-forming enzyme family protein [Amycolatopsis sp.]
MLSRFLQEAAVRCPFATALTFEGRSYTYGELDGAANAVAHRLVQHGLGPGRRAAVVMMNRPEWVIATQAVLRTGAAVVTPLGSGTLPELRHALDLAEPDHILAETRTAEVLSTYPTGAELTCVDADRPAGWESWQSVFASTAREPVATVVPEDSEAVLLLSSGTTGLPKVVRHSHRSLSTIVSTWIRDADLRTADRVQFFFPASTIFGMSTILAVFAQCATLSFFRRFGLESMLEDVQRSRITIGMAAAPVAVAMANHPGLEDYDLSSLRYLVWGATPISKDVAQEVTRRTGVRWLHVYGITEAGQVAANPVDEPERWRLDSPGRIAHGLDIRFVAADGKELPPGEPGELHLRSGQTMLGYLPPEADSGVFEGDGWLRTGDIGFLDEDGWLHLVDRAKELIKVSGFSVSPVEIEKTLFSHPDVDDCGVYPVDDPVAGQRPAAAVVPRPGADLDPAELIEWTRTRMSSYKRLAKVSFVAEIPRTPSGKVLRRKIPEVVARAVTR